MKFKKFFVSCSPNVRRKRLEEVQNESKYANLRPISKQQHASVPDFVSVGRQSQQQQPPQVQRGSVVDSSQLYGGSSSAVVVDPPGGSSRASNGSSYAPGPGNGFDFGSWSYNNGAGAAPNQRMKQSKSASQFYVQTCEYGNDDGNNDFGGRNGVERKDSERETLKSSGLKRGDRIVWVRDETGRWESGVVKWLGVIEGEAIAGIEFDFALNLGSGLYQNRRLFECKRNHGGLVAVAGLMLEDDFLSTEPAGGRGGASYNRSGVSGALERSLNGDLQDYADERLRSTGRMDVDELPQQLSPVQDRQQNHHSQRLSSSPCLFDQSTQSLERSGEITPTFLEVSGTSVSPVPLSPRSPKAVQQGMRPLKMQRVPYVRAPLRSEDAERFSGTSKGIQGNRNSCYLDATLFSMFSFTGAFDTILMTPCPNELSSTIQEQLREEVVNTLRKELFVPADNVMAIRTLMHHLDDKMTGDEMDPAEFLQYLFKEILKLPEFIKLSSNESDFFHQVLVQATEEDKFKVPSVQRLFEKSLMMQQLRLKEIPAPALILQMPRSGKDYKMFQGIFPNLTIDITDLLENTPRMCVICGKLAVVECPECYGRFTQQNSNDSNDAESMAFCHICAEQAHKKTPKYYDHRPKWRRIEYSPEVLNYVDEQKPLIDFNNGHTLNGYSTDGQDYSRYHHNIPRVKLDLVAVICIETSHFVSFVKCGTDRLAPWAMFDSMADRVENINGGGHNIPQVKLLGGFGEWLDQMERNMEDIPGNIPAYTPELKRFISDAYICIYTSPEANMFR